MYTVDSKAIDVMVKKARDKRKDKYEESHHELVDMKPEFVKALENCVNFSGSHIIL